MDKSHVLQKIPYDQEFSYTETKESYLEELSRKKQEASVVGCVNWLMEDYAQSMNANGMEKFIIMLASMLFMMENKSIDPDTAYGVKWDILDFETGDYDHLFDPEDLAHIKEDIRIINCYFNENPKLIEGVTEDRERARTE